MKEIKRIDLINFSSIVRRENVPYYVYEVDKLYAEEKRLELNRELVHKSLVGTGSRRFAWYYDMVERQLNNSFYLLPREKSALRKLRRSFASED